MTDRLYHVAGVLVQVRSTDAHVGRRVDALLGRFALTGADPNASDLRYSFVVGEEPRRRGQRSFRFLYREISQLTRTTTLADLLNTLAADLIAMVPRLLPDLYALQAGVVTRDHGAVVLVGAGPSATRRLVAAFCARGYTYATSDLLLIDPAGRSWFAVPLPLACPDAASAAELRAAGLAVPTAAQGGDSVGAQDAAYPFHLDLAPPSTARPGPTPEHSGPPGAVRALVVETGTSEHGCDSIVPLSRARAVLRLLAHSSNFQPRAAERPALLRDLLGGAACYELRRPMDPDAQRAADNVAAATLNRFLTAALTAP